MAAMDHKKTYRNANGMSALPPNARLDAYLSDAS